MKYRNIIFDTKMIIIYLLNSFSNLYNIIKLFFI